MAEGSFRSATGFTENGQILYRFDFLRHFRETVQKMVGFKKYCSSSKLKNMQSLIFLFS